MYFLFFYKMDNQISESAPNKALFVAILTFIIPIIPTIYFIIVKKFEKTSLIMIGIGALTFFISALILERTIHILVFLIFPQLQNTIWPYYTYGAFMAGLFEETGRLITFIILSKSKGNIKINNLNSIYYGIGHGGIEAILIVSLTYFVYYIYCKRAIKNTLDQKTFELLKNVFINLSRNSYSQMLYPVYERIIAVNYHICASVIVWIGVMKNKIYLYFIAILLHFFTDFSLGVGIEFQYYSKSISLLYIIVSDMTILTLILAIIFWIKYIDNESKEINNNESLPLICENNEIENKNTEG